LLAGSQAKSVHQCTGIIITTATATAIVIILNPAGWGRQPPHPGRLPGATEPSEGATAGTEAATATS